MGGAGNLKAEKLRQACEQGFHKYPKSCSHAVMYLIRQYKPEQPYFTANDLIDHLAASHEWQEVSLAELSALASQGDLVVGGAKDGGHGHVIGVYPGTEKPRGGYYFTNKVTGEKLLVQSSGMYARAMSTSMGTFPGAMSNGDKTVRDPWGELAFRKVRFWKFIGPTQNQIISTSVSKQRWDPKRTGAVHPPQAIKAAAPSSSIRRWRLEADSQVNSLDHPDHFTRWQR